MSALLGLQVGTGIHTSNSPEREQKSISNPIQSNKMICLVALDIFSPIKLIFKDVYLIEVRYSTDLLIFFFSDRLPSNCYAISDFFFSVFIWIQDWIQHFQRSRLNTRRKILKKSNAIQKKYGTKTAYRLIKVINALLAFCNYRHSLIRLDPRLERYLIC